MLKQWYQLLLEQNTPRTPPPPLQLHNQILHAVHRQNNSNS